MLSALLFPARAAVVQRGAPAVSQRHNVQMSAAAAPAFARAVAADKHVDITFEDGSAFRFHSLWLRDACRDDEHVAGHAGERYLTATPVGPSGVRPDLLSAAEAAVGDDGLLHITWTEDSFGPHEMAADPPRASTFEADFLRTYAEVAAERIAPPAASDAKPPVHDEFAFLSPYSGFAGARAPLPDEISLWKAEELEIPVFQHDEILDPASDANLRCIQTMLKVRTWACLRASGTCVRLPPCAALPIPSASRKLCMLTLQVGCVAIDGCEDAGEIALRHLADNAFGGLQKDPTRDIANWKIVRKDGATSVSYDHLKRLNQHTDSSIPPHGVPALCLLMHYAQGSGTNTFTDGFAVAGQLKVEDPEGYHLLTKYGYDAERDFVASRVDSPQAYNRGLIVSTQQPLLQLDDTGALKRIQYNEVFRTPLTLPYDVFPKWYRAFSRFVELVHSEEFERKVRAHAPPASPTCSPPLCCSPAACARKGRVHSFSSTSRPAQVPMTKGRFFLMNNWRVLHGRAGGTVSSDRMLVGGTITRESIYSQARRLLREKREGGFADVSQEEELAIRIQMREVEAELAARGAQ